MNITQVGELLARIQVHDNRKIDALTVEEWHHDLNEVSYPDAIEAVRAHRRTSNDYLTLSHVLDGVRIIRDARLDVAPASRWAYLIDERLHARYGDVVPLEVRRTALADARRRIADGEPVEAVYGEEAPAVSDRRLPELEGILKEVPDK